MSKIKNEMSKKLNNASIDQALSRAETHSKQGEFLEAEALYATVIMSFPNNGRAKQGLESLKGVSTEYDPSRPPRATINILMGLINQKMLEPVVKQAENLLNHYPNAIMLWNILGIASAQLSHFDQAIRAFEKIISLTPKEASAHYNLGNVYKDNGLIQQAIEAYTKALELQPNYEHAFNNLTVLLSSHKQAAKKRQLDVLDSYKKLRIVSVDNSQRDFRAGVLLQKEGKLVDAINAYRKAIKQWSNNADAHYNMAHALHDQGKLEEAIEAFKGALKIKPNNADAYYNMGIALQDQGKLDEAIEAYNKALAIKPDYAEIYNSMGIALQAKGELEQAIEAHKTALFFKPEYVDAHNNVANVLKTQGKLKASLTAYGKALAIDPFHAEAIKHVATLKLQLLNSSLIEHEVFEQLNDNNADLFEMPVLQILRAIQAFISDDKNLVQKHLENYTNIHPSLISALDRKDHIFCQAYYVYLSKLLQFPTEFLQSSKGKNIIYHLGESHCLSFAHHKIIWEGKEHLIVPKITLGGKAFHFSSTKPNAYQEITKTNLFSLPNRSKVFISFGEIDCRHSEGILLASRKFNKSVITLVENTIERYLNWFVKQNKHKNHQLYFFNVPAPVYNENITHELNANVAEVVMKFNSVMSKYLEKCNFKLIDVYGVTVGTKCFSNLKYQIDGRHLGPQTISQITPQLDRIKSAQT